MPFQRLFNATGILAEVTLNYRTKKLYAMKEILLVEDDMLHLKIISYILENSGYNVECATDGLQGLQMACNKKYDLIVTDIQMPQLSGLDLLSKVRTSEHCRNTKVIVMSILNNDYYLAESLARGADEFLRKPVTAKGLVQCVKRVLLQVHAA